MPKIKLKPELNSIEVGIGNVVNLQIKAGESVDVSTEIYQALLDLGHFDPAAEDEDEAMSMSISGLHQSINKLIPLP